MQPSPVSNRGSERKHSLFAAYLARESGGGGGSRAHRVAMAPAGAAGAAAPVRVASLLPSATEMLCAIGGEHLLVGRSHEDDYPTSVADRPILTATNLPEGLSSAEIDTMVSESIRSGQELYAILAEELRRCRPTVVLTQNLCNVCSVCPSDVEKAIEGLEPRPLVLSFDPFCMEDIFQDMLRLGGAVGLEAGAEEAVAQLRGRVQQVASTVAANSAASRPKVAFLEWADPVFVGGHWTPELVELAGGTHVLNGAGKKSYRVPVPEVVAADPDFVIFCPCGLTLEQACSEAASERSAWIYGMRAIREDRAGCVVDGGAMFNRPGPRLVDALEWLAGWIRGGGRGGADAACLKALPPTPADFPWVTWPEATRAPKRTRDIEDFVPVHTAAVQRGELSYSDPSTGYSVFSELHMLKRGYCCGSGCRHCPFGHFNLEGRPRKNRIEVPRLLGVGVKGGLGGGPLVAWEGSATEAPQGATVCLVFGAESYAAVGPDQTPVGCVMDWARERRVELLAVPQGRLQEALDLVRPSEWRAGGRPAGGRQAWIDALGAAC